MKLMTPVHKLHSSKMHQAQIGQLLEVMYNGHYGGKTKTHVHHAAVPGTLADEHGT
jgi:hypothetical protein